MQLHKVQYFLAVARHASVSEAARELHITQPAVSDAIKALENDLRVQLFRRVRQRVHLTEAGKYYADKMSAVVKNFLSINNEMLYIGTHKMTVRLGIPPMIGSFIFPTVFTGLENTCPDINLELKEGGSLGLLQEIDSESIDLAIVAASARFQHNKPSITYIKISSTELQYCVSPKHHFSEKKFINIKEIDGEHLLLFKEGYIQREIITTCFREAEIDPKVVLYTTQLFTIASFIRRNIGTSFLYADAVKLIEGIVPISLKPKIKLDLFLVWKTGRTHQRSMQSAVQSIVRLFPTAAGIYCESALAGPIRDSPPEEAPA
ncbi:MAG: LysR family transcriptional regulator [Candidatus Desulfovibrio kirbyi]|jgi:DNA-binding transcriptional LysR family regulator|uniref:LysR family transcriptional regulator n=1 Tax=Candidatus Desulfovibrio kirbyi TaxID=2696086 RepID=A0A6L2R5M4_9BACT|nr:LysR family transcriptional regulator [Desulfovibrio sp.]GFH62813.1 MAG: LysR family transcriptional regulator [Candidatus Desulfovibrio kirbyi]